MQHSIEFDYLKQNLKDLVGGRDVYFICNPGNWGDALIAEGSRKFLSDAGFAFRTMNFGDKRAWITPFIKGGVVIMVGSGRWVRYYSDNLMKALAKLAWRFDVVILPSTFAKTYDYKQMHFYRRDQFESREHMPNSSFCHDMAFYLTPECSPEGEGTAYFFREDCESNQRIKIPSGNRDLSCEGDQDTPTTAFFDAIKPYRTIHTDRLHVGIASALLGKELHLYPNSYFKNLAVYKSSIEGYFPDVHFHDSHQ